MCVVERLAEVDTPCVVDVKKPRDTVLDVTVKDDVDELGHDVIVIDSIYDAGTADRWAEFLPRVIVVKTLKTVLIFH